MAHPNEVSNFPTTNTETELTTILLAFHPRQKNLLLQKRNNEICWDHLPSARTRPACRVQPAASTNKGQGPAVDSMMHIVDLGSKRAFSGAGAEGLDQGYIGSRSREGRDEKMKLI